MVGSKLDRKINVKKDVLDEQGQNEWIFILIKDGLCKE